MSSLKKEQARLRAKRFRHNLSVQFNLPSNNATNSLNVEDDTSFEEQPVESNVPNLNMNNDELSATSHQNDDPINDIEDNLMPDDFETQLDDDSDDDSSDEDLTTDNDTTDKDTTKPIYKDSKIKLDDFNFAFMILVKKMNLNVKSRQTLVEFIKAITPSNENNIPETYYKLKKMINTKKEAYYNSCNICSMKITGVYNFLLKLSFKCVVFTSF